MEEEIEESAIYYELPPHAYTLPLKINRGANVKCDKVYQVGYNFSIRQSIF